ncbi:MAG: DUF116 domain-containing protein [Endomicrobia bacterium]|nr:DUF116 domain-containing protein [Endomicrobiia bacterium]
MKSIKSWLFYKLLFPSSLWMSSILPKKFSLQLLKWILEQNNKIVLSRNNRNIKTILILLPRCLQYFSCEFNLVSSIENCRRCGKCKIKDIVEFKEKYKLENIKVAPGGRLAKFFVEQARPDIVIAVACELELIIGIKEIFPIRTLAVSNIVVNKPCVNTDVEIRKIEEFINLLVKR